MIDDDLETHVGSEVAAHVIREVHNRNGRSDVDVGFRRRNMAALLVRYYADMWKVLRNLSAAVRPGAYLFFVIGDNKTVAGSKTIAIRSGDALPEMGVAVGWRLLERIPITVTKENLLHLRHAISTNEVLVFRRPATGSTKHG